MDGQKRMNAEDEYTARLAAHRDKLHACLYSLYGRHADFENWFAQLLQQAGHRHAQRSAALRALDARRQATPDWFAHERMLGYCAYVDRFAGDLQGLAQRIDYLRELGVRHLHLLPFLKMRAQDNDGGFAVSSFEAVEPSLGSMADLEALTAALREADISLCADFVLNHVADDHPWAQAARSGDAQHRAFFHLFDDRAQCTQYERHLHQVFPHSAPGNFTYVEELGAWVWTTFYPYQWDLNYANPQVFAAMADALLQLANRGIEVFRLDSAPFLWKRLGSSCQNLPEVHVLLKALRGLIELVAPGCLLLAEAIVPSQELPPYFGAGDECHLAYHSSLMAAGWAALAQERSDILREVMASTPTLPMPASWLCYVRCHDDIGWQVLANDYRRMGSGSHELHAVSAFYNGRDPRSYAQGAAFQSDDPKAAHGSNGMSASLLGFERARDAQDTELALRRLLLLYGLAFSFGGLPVIYMGDELAQTNDRADSAQSRAAADGRWLQRPVLDSTRLAQRHDAQQPSGRCYQALRELIQLRAVLPELAANAPRQLLRNQEPALLAFERGASLRVLANFSSRPLPLPSLRAELNMPASDWHLLWRAQASASDEALLPWEMLWMQRR